MSSFLNFSCNCFFINTMLSWVVSIIPEPVKRLFGIAKDAVQYVHDVGKRGSVDDFVYQGNDKGGKITAINKNDKLLGMKPGGAVEQLFARYQAAKQGPTDRRDAAADNKPIIINVHIGQKKIDQIVIDALNSPTGKRYLSPYAS